MQPLEEKDSSPLEDTEITRLIKVSREVGYKKQEKIPERNLVDFKPTSISQIATSFDKKKQNTYEAEPLQSSETLENNELENVKKALDNSPSDSGDNPNYADVEASLQENQKEKEEGDTSENSSKNLDLSDDPAKEDKKDSEAVNLNKEPEAISPDAAPNEPTISEETPNVPQKNTNTNVEEAKQEGIEIGKKIASKELENEQQKTLETFRDIIDNIRKRETIDKTEMMQSVLGVVTRLASERAGSAIDENPEPFKNKIIAFVEKIEKASRKLVLKLHPKDAHLIEKNLIGSFHEEELEIKEASELFRGDFILQLGSVEIGDLISEQISINEENDEKAIETQEIHEDAKNETDIERSEASKSLQNESKDSHAVNNDNNEK
jgi:flagellar biosynthesis/type III secretory pathway protein FliH